MQASQYRYHVSKYPPFSREQEQVAAHGIRRLRDAAWEAVLLDKTPDQVAAAFSFPEREQGDFSGREQERSAAALFAEVMAGPAWASWSSLSLPANRKSPLLASGLPAAARDLAHLVSACDPDLIVLPRAGGKTAAIIAAVRDFEAHNVGLCFALAQQFVRPNMSFEAADLAAFAFEGLRTAVLRFDPDKGFRFSTYASNWIRHKVGRAIDDLSRPIRLPVHALDTGRKIAKVRAMVEKTTGAPASVDQVADELGLDHCKVHKVATLYTGQVFPLDQPTTFVASDNAADRFTLAGTLHDESTVAADEMVALKERAALVREAIQNLTDKQRLVIDERVMADTPATLKELGAVLGVSRERVRQIECESLGEVRSRLAKSVRLAAGRCVLRRQAQREVAHA